MGTLRRFGLIIIAMLFGFSIASTPDGGAFRTLGVLAVMVASLALYMFPTIEAYARKRVNIAAIGTVNLFFGWSILGWVLALVWALKHEEPTNTVVQQIQSQSVADELQKLSALHRDGVITDEQLERQKAALLK